MFAPRRLALVGARTLSRQPVRIATPSRCATYATEAASEATTSDEPSTSSPSTAAQQEKPKTAAPFSAKPAPSSKTKLRSSAQARHVSKGKMSTPVAKKLSPESPRHGGPTITPSPAHYTPSTAVPLRHRGRIAPENQEPLSRADVAGPVTSDWTTTYHGISRSPVTQEQFEVLIARVEVADVEVKPDGVIYLPEAKYRRKLNETFGPMGWGMVPRGEAIVGDNIVTREWALFADGRFVSQAQGENSYFSAESLPAAVEGCKSNALMRCCKDLGIASELWDPHYVRWFKKLHMESVWAEHVPTKKKKLLWFKSGRVEVVYPFRLSNSTSNSS